MKKLIYVAILSLGMIGNAMAQKEGEPVNVASDVPLGGFPGCSVSAPKNGCDSRIVCNGVGTLFGNTGMDLQAATEEASIEARNELAKFYSSKQKAQQSLAKVKEDTAKSTSDGGKSITSSMTRMMASVSSTSAESILSGVQILGRQVDVNQQTVTVKAGVSCKSQAAASQSQAAAVRSANPNAGSVSSSAQPAGEKSKAQSAEAFKTGPGTLRNMTQQTKNADDF
jgi:uncharacterized protein YfcZ (UPF0381/DUF406 family)